MTLADHLREEAAKLPEGPGRAYLERLAADLDADRASRGIAPETPPPVPPLQSTPVADVGSLVEVPTFDPRAAWNEWLGRFRKARKVAEEALSLFGRGTEYQACVEDVLALKVEGKALAAKVAEALGRPMAEAEVTGGFPVEVAS